MSYLNSRFPLAGSCRVAVIALVLLALPYSAQADNWRVAPDLDDARLAINASSGTISLNDGSIFSVPINLTEWISIGPYAIAINGPKSDVVALGYGGCIRLQTPFGSRAYRLFSETYLGAVGGIDDGPVDGVDVETKLRYQAIELAGVEFQVWSRLTWSLALGGTTVDDDLDSIHPRLNSFNFAAQTSLRWYL